MTNWRHLWNPRIEVTKCDLKRAELTREEIERISKIVTSLRFSKNVFAFTEQGVSMIPVINVNCFFPPRAGILIFANHPGLYLSETGSGRCSSRWSDCRRRTGGRSSKWATRYWIERVSRRRLARDLNRSQIVTG